MVLVRTVLIVVCTTFAILMNSCIGYYDECASGSAYCEDSTAANFNLSNEARNWWINDSIGLGSVTFKNQLGATLLLYKTQTSARLTSLAFDTYKFDRKNDCKELVDCDITIKYTAYAFTYFQSEYNFKISLNLLRAIPSDTKNIERSNWPEYLAFTQNANQLKLIPGQFNPGYNKQELIPSILVNDTTYTNIIHVYDSSSINNSKLAIIGYYYTPTDGIIRYYFNNNDVWTIQ